MLNERRRNVLAALVEEYIASVQPVGSKVLVDRYRLGCSAATVRSELAALEETGHVFQPHTSAGRVPTDTGYRAFVDDMVRADGPVALSNDELARLHVAYEEFEREISDVLRETAGLLSRLTSYVAVVAAPALGRARIRRVSLVALSANRALVVVVTDSGQVANRTAEFAEAVSAGVLARVEAMLGATVEGHYGDEVVGVRSGIEDASGLEARVARRTLEEVIDCLAEADADRVLTGGVSALLSHPEFAHPGAVRPLLALLEDGLALLAAVTEGLRPRMIEVRIGHENDLGALANTSFVAARYGAGDGGGIVGLIGPTRMDYRRAMGAVSAVSGLLSEYIEA